MNIFVTTADNNSPGNPIIIRDSFPFPVFPNRNNSLCGVDGFRTCHRNMERFRTPRRVQIDEAQALKYDTAEPNDGGQEDREENGMRLRSSGSKVTEDQEPFMGVKVRRKASRHRDYRGDYVDVPSRPYLMKILEKQG